MEPFIPAASAIAGFVIPGLIGYFIWKRQKQLENTVKVYDDFHSKDMFEARCKAWDLLESRPEATMGEMKAEPELGHVSVLVHYFERVHVLASEGLIDKRLMSRLLGRYFDFWEAKLKPLRGREQPGSDWSDLFSALDDMSGWLSKAA